VAIVAGWPVTVLRARHDGGSGLVKRRRAVRLKIARWRIRDVGLGQGYGNSLEWATSSPPPRHNFTSLPRIRSERPAFELHHPHMIERMKAEAHPNRTWEPLKTLEASKHLKIPTE